MIAFIYKLFSLIELAELCTTNLYVILVTFWVCSLSFQVDAIAIMSFAMAKGKFEQIVFSFQFRLLMYSSILWLRCLISLLLQVTLT